MTHKGTTALVFKKPLSKQEKKIIKKMQKGTIVLPTPIIKSEYDGVKMNRIFNDD